MEFIIILRDSTSAKLTHKLRKYTDAYHAASMQLFYSSVTVCFTSQTERASNPVGRTVKKRIGVKEKVSDPLWLHRCEWFWTAATTLIELTDTVTSYSGGPVEAGQGQTDKGCQGSHEAQQWEARKQLLNHWSCSLKRWAVCQQLHKSNPRPRGCLTTTTAFTADLKGGTIHISCLLTYKTVKMRVNLPSIQDFRSRLRKQTANVSADPRHKLFKLVPSVICYRVLLTNTSRHRDSFFSTGCDSYKHWKWHDTHSLLPVCTVVSS